MEIPGDCGIVPPGSISHGFCYVVRMEEGRRTFKILTGTPTGKRPLERPRRRWEDNIRMDLEVIGINAGNWVDSAQDRDSISHGVSYMPFLNKIL